jgi:Na+-transporting NADH:ubiquinone oxidoreductase subunit A
MSVITVRRGLDLPIAGGASGSVVALSTPSSVGLCPQEIPGFQPRLLVHVGDAVQVGTPVLADKNHPDVVVVSPVSGRVADVRRGPKRVIEDVVLDVDGDDAVRHRAWNPADLARIPRGDAVSGLLASGLWTTLRTRPLSVVPAPSTIPQSVLISATETGPLQPGPDVLLDPADRDAFVAGVVVMRALTAGPTFLVVRAGETHPVLAHVEGVQLREIRGPHPAGDAAVQVNLIDPPRGQGQVFTVKAWDVVRVGRWFLTGQGSGERVYAAVGAGVKAPRFVRTLLGAPIPHVVGDVTPGPLRYVRGSVLTGDAVSADRFASAVHHAVHVLPDTVDRFLLGWATPNLGWFSSHRAFLSGFLGTSKSHDLRPGTWGGHRAMIPVDIYKSVVVTPEIDVGFLFKSILAGDVEESIRLGLLDLTPEEAALCTYVCPSKIEYDVLLRQGLAQFREEM